MSTQGQPSCMPPPAPPHSPHLDAAAASWGSIDLRVSTGVQPFPDSGDRACYNFWARFLHTTVIASWPNSRGYLDVDGLVARQFFLDDEGLFPWVVEVLFPSIPVQEIRERIVTTWHDPAARDAFRLADLRMGKE